MAELLRAPEVAAGAAEVVISGWLVKVGDQFKAGDPIVVIETDKAVVEVEAETTAALLGTLVDGGAQVEVGAPIAVLGSADELGADLDSLMAGLGVPPAAAAEETPLAAVPATEAESPAPGQDPAPQVLESDTASASGAVPKSRGRVFVSPIARKLLRDAGLPFEDITGTGPNGRITRDDARAAVAAAAQAPAASQPTASPAASPARPAVSTEEAKWTDIPHSRIRRAIAARLTQSKRDVPHFYVKRTAVIDDLLALRAQLNEHSPVKLSVNDFLVRAVAVAHTRVPDANVIWTEDAIRRFDAVDVSVAIASEKGLVTPVLRGVEKSSLGAISAAVKTYVEQANAGRLQQKDLEGGSISVTNLGMYGVDEFSAIINPPQSAILAVGAGRQTPIVVAGEVTVATVVDLVLSVDHRAIDGALAAQWMGALIDTLEHPFRLVV
jgi:pyruvate dehydrogenase E2 component (dihydrolipoamide acetyltransferase)